MTPEEELKQSLQGTTGNSNPVVNNATTPPPPPPPPPPNPEVVHDYTDFWGRSETKTPQNLNTNQPPAANVNPQQPGNTGATTPAPTTPAGVAINKKAAEMSARAAVGTINVLQVSLCKPLVNWQFKKQGAKRFGAENFEKGLDDIVLGITPTDAAEAARKKRINKFLEQRDEKIRNIPFNKEEEEEMIYAWKTYFELTGKTVSPELLIAASTIGNLGKRAIDIAMWD